MNHDGLAWQDDRPATSVFAFNHGDDVDHDGDDVDHDGDDDGNCNDDHDHDYEDNL